MTKKILVVDDHEDVVETIASILGIENCDIEKAYNGHDCLEKADDQVKLVFLDIMLPDMNGAEIAKKLREKYKDNLKIVYVSILPKEEVDLSNVDGHIKKPFNVDDILIAAKSIPDAA